jgi:methionyl-tRNA formyltransferase
MPGYVVATVKPWNIAAFERHKGHAPDWHLITDRETLNPATLKKIDPRYIFFPHWTWIVPDELLDAYECVCFHETDVPFGRGGSPIQNLIARGHKETKLVALRMVKEVDAGPVYLKEPLDLQGSAQDVFERTANMVYDMMDEIIKAAPQPLPQAGKEVVFSRRTPEMSELPRTASAATIYDHIRMLDAETYPHAFIRHGEFVITFRNAQEEDGVVKAVAEIRKAHANQ